jgi:hypothetical protein
MQRIQAYLKKMEDLSDDPREVSVARKVLENLYNATGQRDTRTLTRADIESFIAGITASDVSEGAKLHFTRIALDFFSFLEELKEGAPMPSMPSPQRGASNKTGVKADAPLDFMPGIIDKTCPKCNTRQSIDNKFCSNCGLSFFEQKEMPEADEIVTQPEVPEETEEDRKEKEKKDERRRIIKWSLLAVAAVVVAFFIIQIFVAFVFDESNFVEYISGDIDLENPYEDIDKEIKQKLKTKGIPYVERGVVYQFNHAIVPGSFEDDDVTTMTAFVPFERPFLFWRRRKSVSFTKKLQGRIPPGGIPFNLENAPETDENDELLEEIDEMILMAKQEKSQSIVVQPLRSHQSRHPNKRVLLRPTLPMNYHLYIRNRKTAIRTTSDVIIYPGDYRLAVFLHLPDNEVDGDEIYFNRFNIEPGTYDVLLGD